MRSRIDKRSASSRMHASSTVSCMSIAHDETYSSSTSDTPARIWNGVALYSSTACPSPFSSDVALANSLRLVTAPSLNAISATSTSRCEIVKRLADPVCCGTHSYPGLTQNARRYLPLRPYSRAMLRENDAPRSAVYSLLPRMVCMNVEASPVDEVSVGSSIAVTTEPTLGNPRSCISRLRIHVAGNTSLGSGAFALKPHWLVRSCVGLRCAWNVAGSMSIVKAASSASSVFTASNLRSASSMMCTVITSSISR
mmetsp:Transcript_35696/g.73385  ORF Transcript_35696/g.73385 Transcript_35696/m.73385 type:complete len:254 (+) Transcript_35696:1040-1801(+)